MSRFEIGDRLIGHPDRVVPEIHARFVAPEVLPVTHGRGSAENFEFPPDEIFGARDSGAFAAIVSTSSIALFINSI